MYMRSACGNSLTCTNLRGCFFFSSRRRHTRYIGDWSSDVCSSDLFLNRNTSTDTYGLIDGGLVPRTPAGLSVEFPGFMIKYGSARLESVFYMVDLQERSEERRVGKECGSWWWMAV